MARAQQGNHRVAAVAAAAWIAAGGASVLGQEAFIGSAVRKKWGLLRGLFRLQRDGLRRDSLRHLAFEGDQACLKARILGRKFAAEG